MIFCLLLCDYIYKHCLSIHDLEGLILIPSIIYKFTFDSIHDFYIFAFLFHESAFWLYVL